MSQLWIDKSRHLLSVTKNFIHSFWEVHRKNDIMTPALPSTGLVICESSDTLCDALAMYSFYFQTIIEYNVSLFFSMGRVVLSDETGRWMSCRMYSWLRSSHCWPTRWVSWGEWQAAKAHNCAPEPTCKSHIQTKETCGTHLKRVSTPYGPTRQIHTLIHSACTLCSTVHQSELFISARLSRGERKERERARKSI